MKKLLLILLSFTSPAHLKAQFGPGGVGSSSSNGLWLIGDSIQQADGSSVALWPDQSGNGNDAIQVTAGFQPTFTSTGNINGRSSVTFDGTEQMEVPDADILDGTDGISYFAVVRPTGLNGAARGILGKRITFSTNVQYAYTFFYYTGNRVFLDVHTSNNRFNTPTVYSNNTNYINAFTFDGSLAAASRSRIYTNGSVDITSTESSTTLPDSDQPVSLGALNVDYGTYFIGEMAEILHFNYCLNSAERLIVENYLGAKYGIAINTDLFTHQGVYNHDVAGIGRIDASNIHNDAQGSGIVRIRDPNGLGNNEFYIWGHDNGDALFSDSTGIPTKEMLVRMDRVWRATETGSITDFDVRFDLSGVPGNYQAEDLILMIDSDNDGSFSDESSAGGGLIIGATAISSGIYEFQNVTGMNNNLRFTIGYTNISTSCLISSSNGYTVNATLDPVELIPSSVVCPFGYNYNLNIAYEITFNYSNIPASMFTMQGTITCGSSSHFFNLPNGGGVGNVTSGSNVFTSDTDCATATPETRNCTIATLQIEGPGIAAQFTNCSEGINALPIELISFTGQALGTEIVLNWKTATETQNDYFEILRSEDGIDFEVIALQDGAGTSLEQLSYTYTDKDVSVGRYYYQLKQVDFDGKSSLSNIIEVYLHGLDFDYTTPKGLFLVPDFPLSIPIEMDPDAHYEVEVFNASGVRVLATPINKPTLQAPTLSKGIYFLRVLRNGTDFETFHLIAP